MQIKSLVAWEGLETALKSKLEATIRVSTNIPGYESFAIPVVIEPAADR